MSGDRSRGASGVPDSPLAGIRDWLITSPIRLQVLVAVAVLLATVGVATGVLVLLGGVSFQGSSPADAGPPTAVPTPTPAPTATATPGPTATPADAVGDYRPATVRGVLGGGVVAVQFADGAVRRLPLAAVEVPDAGGDDPDAFDGVLAGAAGRACLGTHGERATAALGERLAGASVGVQVVSDGTVPGNAGLLLRNRGRVVNRDLVRRGDARATTDRYADEMDDARADGRGLWACGTVDPGDGSGDVPATVAVEPPEAADRGGLRVVEIRPAPPEGAPLAAETVTLRNTGTTTVHLDGWTLGDADGTRRTLLSLATPEDRRLQPGERLVVHTGHGPPTEGHLYLGHPHQLWNDDGDVVRLRNRRQAPPRTVTVRYGDAVPAPAYDVHTTAIRFHPYTPPTTDRRSPSSHPSPTALRPPSTP